MHIRNLNSRTICRLHRYKRGCFAVKRAYCAYRGTVIRPAGNECRLLKPFAEIKPTKRPCRIILFPNLHHNGCV